jgi:hypothetical protein
VQRRPNAIRTGNVDPPLTAIADEPDGDRTSQLDKLVAEAVGVEVIRQDNETLLEEPAPEFRHNAVIVGPGHRSSVATSRSARVTSLEQELGASGGDLVLATAAGEADEVLMEFEPDPVVAVDPG